ncbi:MAG: FxsA family protein, partial [Aestuariivirgaceae bacterium]
VLNDARQQSARNEIPVTAAIHGVFILAAGLLLLTPGFVTDTIGFVFLVPPLRLLIAGKAWGWIKENMDVTVMRPGHTERSDGQPRPESDQDFDVVIEGEAVEVDETAGPDEPGQTKSPWKRINHTDG